MPKTALAEELAGLNAGSELRLSYEDFLLLFLCGNAHHELHQVGTIDHWSTELAREHRCRIRNERHAQTIVFKKE